MRNSLGSGAASTAGGTHAGRDHRPGHAHHPRLGRASLRRVATPEAAIAAGASYLVVGRPITGASDPLKAAEAIVARMQRAEASREKEPVNHAGV